MTKKKAKKSEPSVREWIEAQAANREITIPLFMELDDALIGLADPPGKSPCAVYDYHRCIELFMAQGMTREDALEYMEFNVVGSGLGKGTPIFVERPDE